MGYTQRKDSWHSSKDQVSYPVAFFFLPPSMTCKLLNAGGRSGGLAEPSRSGKYSPQPFAYFWGLYLSPVQGQSPASRDINP